MDLRPDPERRASDRFTSQLASGGGADNLGVAYRRACALAVRHGRATAISQHHAHADGNILPDAHSVCQQDAQVSPRSAYP